MPTELTHYRELLTDIKTRVRQAQHRAALSANAEMLLLYWDIGRLIDARQKQEGWGAGVIPRLAVDLKNELPEHKGFSPRNIFRMLRFYRDYPQLPEPVGEDLSRSAPELKHLGIEENTIMPPTVAQLENTKLKQRAISPQPAAKLKRGKSECSAIVPLPVAQLKTTESEQIAILSRPVTKLGITVQEFFGIPWAHHVILLEKLPDPARRLWYARQAAQNGWSRETLAVQIKNRAHERAGAAVTNFQNTLPAPHAAIAQGLLKDPYIFCNELTRALPANLATSLPSIESIEAEFSDLNPPNPPAPKTPLKQIKPKSKKSK